MSSHAFSYKSFVGSIFMVSGCAMGAGCLAMPLLASGSNFIFSVIFLILSAIFSYYLASVCLEIFLLYKNEVNISTIVKNNFGNKTVAFSGFINGALMYALLSVYITGGADLLNKTIFPLMHFSVSSKFAIILFLFIFLPIFFKGAYFVVHSNKIIFYIKLTTFLCAVIFGLKFISHDLLKNDWLYLKYIPRAMPIFLGALWFHFMIPVIAKLNNYDRERCKKIFAFGLLIPLLLYILWISVILSLIPRDHGIRSFYLLLHNHESVGMMIKYAMQTTAIPEVMKISLNLFSNIALLTSFLTVGLSTYDYIRDTFKISQTAKGKVYNLVYTMLPPTIFAIFFPNGFIFVLQQAIILLIITNIITLCCVIKDYNRLNIKPNKVLVCILLLGLFILISLQILDNFSLLPEFGIN